MSPRRPALLSLLVAAGCASVPPSEMPPVPPQEAFREVLTGATRFGIELGEPLDEALRPEPGQDRARVPYKSDHPLWTVRVHCRGGWDGPVELLEAIATEEHVNDVPDWEAYLGVRRGPIVGQAEGRFRSKWGQTHRIDERHDLLVVATDRPNVYLAYQGGGIFYSALVALDDEALRRRGVVPFEQALADARRSGRAGGELALSRLISIQLLAPDTPGIADDVQAAREAVNRAREGAVAAVEAAWAARREAWTKGDARQRLELWNELRTSLPEPPVPAASHRRRAILAGLRDELLAAAPTEAGRGWDRAPAFVWAQVLLEPRMLDEPAALLVALDRAAAFDQVQGVVAAHAAVEGLRLGKIGFLRGDLEGRWRALIQTASGRRQAALRASGKLEEAAMEAGAAGTSPINFSADRFAKMTERLRQLEPLRGDLDAQVAWHHAHQRDFVDGNRLVDPMWGHTTSMLRHDLSRRLDADAAEHLAAGRRVTAAGRWLEGMGLQFGSTSPAPLRGLAEAARGPEGATEANVRAARALLPVLVALDPPLAPGTDGERLVARLREPPLGDRPAARLLGLTPAGPGDLLEAAGLLGLEVGHCRLVVKDGGYELVPSDGPSGRHAPETLAFAASPLFGISDETRRESERLRAEDAWIQQENAALDESRAWIDAEKARLDALRQVVERAKAQGTLQQHEAELRRGAADERTLNQRVDAHNARASALAARTTAYNAAVGPFNARLSKERYGPVRDLRVKLDAALRARLATRLTAWEADLRARRAGDPGLDREVAWARWFVLGEGAGPALGALRESAAFADRRAEWLAEEAFHQPSEPEVARMVVEFLRRSRSVEKRKEVLDHYVVRYEARVLRDALEAADLAGLTSEVDAALERRKQQTR